MKKFLNKFGIKIILIVVGIIVISNVVDLFLANYKLKNNKILSVPTFYMIDSNDERIDLDLARYKIMNEYDNKENVLVSNYLEYDFQNTGIIIVYPNEEYKIGIDENINIEDYDISVSNFRNGHPEFIEREYKFEDGMFIEKSDTEIGEHLKLFRISAKDKSFEGTYIFKEVVIDNNELLMGKKYLNTTISNDKEKINEIIEKIPYASLVNEYEIKDNKIINIEFNLQLTDEILNNISRILFVLIDDLECVNFTVNRASDITTEIQESAGKKELEIKEMIFNRNDFNSDDVTILELKEFLSK